MLKIEQREIIIRVGAIRVSGRLDAQAGPELKNLWQQYNEQGIHSLLLDLRQVEFIDSIGISALVSGLKQMRNRGGDLKLIGLQSPARAIFELMMLDKVFEIYETEEEALKGF
jgi:anti-sigma B factor antagonist